jgi:preprotein translocase subunit SecG
MDVKDEFRHFRLTIQGKERYNRGCFSNQEDSVELKNYFDIALIITAIALVISVILQNKGVGLGGLTGNSDSGGVFTQRRGIEKTLFWITIGLSVLFFVLTLVTALLSK